MKKPSFYESFINEVSNIELKPYQRIVPYLDDMANVLSASDIELSCINNSNFILSLKSVLILILFGVFVGNFPKIIL